MGQKVSPVGLRLGITRSWDSIWYAGSEYKAFLHEDIMIRKMINKRFKRAGIVRIVVERFPEKININIHTVRPGVIIGQKGASIEAVKAERAAAIETIPAGRLGRDLDHPAAQERRQPGQQGADRRHHPVPAGLDRGRQPEDADGGSGQ